MRQIPARFVIALLMLALAGPVELLAPMTVSAAEPDPTALAAESESPEPEATPTPTPTPTPEPEATPIPSPTPDPSPTPTPGSTPTPTPEPNPTPTPDPTPTPESLATFVFPAPGATSVGTAGTVTVRWTEALPLSNRTLRQYYGRAVDGSCATTTWKRAWTRSVTATSVVVRKHVQGICYRYTLTATPQAGGATTVATSGVVRIPGGWSGTFDLYRTSAFSTQLRWYWCVPASVQMMLNIITGASDHSYASQLRYYRYGRPRRARLFSSRGLDPQSWQLILNRYGGDGYRVVTSSNLTSLLRHAAKRNRLTGKPVGLLVGRGGHAWVMTGFRATADPAISSGFRVTAIRTMGPLWPRQKYRNRYFDARPGTWFSMATVPYFYGRYRDRLGRTPWDGRYVVIVP